MSSTTHAQPVTPESLIERADVAYGAFRAPDGYSRTPPSITAHGEIDAANAQELVDYALRHGDRIDRLVLDMSGVDFFRHVRLFGVAHPERPLCGRIHRMGIGAQRRRHAAAADL